MAMREITVTIAQLGPTRTGLWCPSCQLPSGLGVTAALSGLGVLHVAGCPGCGAKLEEAR